MGYERMSRIERFKVPNWNEVCIDNLQISDESDDATAILALDSVRLKTEMLVSRSKQIKEIVTFLKTQIDRNNPAAAREEKIYEMVEATLEVILEMRAAPQQHKTDGLVFPEAAQTMNEVTRSEDFTETDWEQNTKRPYILGTSNSHTATAHFLRRARRAGFSRDRKVGVLTFDHHIDAQDTYSSDIFNKATFFNHSLEQHYIDGVIVVGSGFRSEDPSITPDYRGVVDFVRCYENDPSWRTRPRGSYKMDGKRYDVPFRISPTDRMQKPQPQIMAETLRMLEKFQRQGITEIYPSIDLDCLLSIDLGLTAAPVNESLIHLINLLGNDHFFNNLWEAYKKTISANPEESIVHLRILIQQIINDQFGITAATIGKIVESARSLGFNIGLSNETTGQVLVGDIVEYNNTDYRGRSAETVRALGAKLINLAQRT